MARVFGFTIGKTPGIGSQPNMTTKNEIIDAIRQATGDPASGPIHEWTPVIADAIDALVNPSKPETKTKTKNDIDTRVMDAPTETR